MNVGLMLAALPIATRHKAKSEIHLHVLQDGAGPSSVDVQASVLVLHNPDAQAIAVPNVAPAAASAPRKQPSKRVAARPVLMPNSTWNAMSALAGTLPRLYANVCHIESFG